VTGLGKYKGRLIILLDVGKVLDFREKGNPEAVAENAVAGGSKAVAQSASAGTK
jgi:hypothetical protein